MHLRKLTLTVGLLGTLFSTWALGLGLGEITLKSTLNQPLDAEIRLLQVRNLSEEDIRVELASTADFQRFGIERLFFLQNLTFDIQLDHPSGPVVRIRSDEPVREPYLVFLIQAQSPSSGRLLREYTLLLDLPVFTAEAPAPVQAPARRIEPTIPATPTMDAPAPAPSASRTAQREGEPYRAPAAPGRSTSPAPSTAAFDGDVYGPVQANDTLWEIASRVRPSGVSVQQSMLAIQRANPDAFINGNINLLKRGQVLRVPESNEWLALDQQSSLREVAAQNNQWSSGNFESASGAELAASSSRPSRERSEEGPRGQLTLTAPGAADRAGETSGAGSAAGRNDALQNELAIVSEQLDATQRENRELSSRILELEEQIATMERLIDVSSAELRALQIAAEQELSTEAAESTMEAAGAEPASDVVVAEETANAEVAVVEEGATPEVASAPVAQSTARVVTPVPAPAPTLIDKLMAQIWTLLGAALALIAGLAYLLYRRRQQDDEWEAFDDDHLFNADADLSGIGDEFMEESAGLDEAMGFSSVDDEASDSNFDTDQPVEAETGDVVAEADIYIAYGKLDQAEEMLRRALANGDAGNVDARLKLLEVLVEKNDVGAFDDEYRALLGFGDGGARARAAELRSGFADAPPFVDDREAAEGQQSAEQMADDIGDLLELGDADVDFGDLDLSFDLDTAQESGVSDPADAEQNTSLDFSLDLSEAVEPDESSGEAPSFGETAFDFELDDAPALEIPESGGTLGDFELALDDEALELDVELELGEAGQSTDDSTTLADFSFDLELDEESSPTPLGDADDNALDLDLLTDELAEEGEDQVLGLEPEGAFDLAETVAVDTEKPSVSEADVSLTLDKDALSFELLADEAGLDIDPLTGSADDGFGIELGDLDLEALDQEMDALVGSVEDDDVAMAVPLALQEEEPADLDLTLQAESLDTIEVAGLAGGNAFSEDQDFDPDDLEDEFDFLAESDEVATKLDLARAYIDMGDQDGARDILDEVNSEGNDEQKREAQALLEKMV